jgi:hypothetical protein
MRSPYVVTFGKKGESKLPSVVGAVHAARGDVVEFAKAEEQILVVRRPRRGLDCHRRATSNRATSADSARPGEFFLGFRESFTTLRS